MTGYKYVGLTGPQAAALFAIVAAVLNNPDWPYESAGQARALAGAQTALAKVVAR